MFWGASRRNVKFRAMSGAAIAISYEGLLFVFLGVSRLLLSMTVLPPKKKH